MSTDIKPGQIWQWNSALPHEGGLVVTKTECGNVHYRYEDEPVKGEFHRDTEHFTERAHLVTAPAPLDPKAVKAGDTVTLVSPASVNRGTVSVPAKIEGVVREVLPDGRIAVHGVRGFFFPSTLTDHQPAPEPEPEWKPGVVADIEIFGDTELRALSDPSKALSFEGYKAPITALDPTAVRAGDTVTIVGDIAKVEGKVRAVFKEDALVFELGYNHFKVTGTDAWTLTDHQPAPEPEPEYENGAVIRTAFSEYHMIAGEFVDIHDGGPLAGNPDVRPLVVIDPADVDVDALARAYVRGLDESTGMNHGGPSHHAMAGMRAALAHLGIEATR